MYEKFLYGVWLLFPLFFFGIALWAKLEKMSKSPKKQNPKDFMRQGFFLLICVAVAIVLDRSVLPGLLYESLPSFIPVGFVQFLLLPVILLIGAMLAGGTKPISIDKAPSASKARKRY